MEKLIKGSNATTKEIGRKVDEIVAWINEHENVFDTNVTDADALVADGQYPDFEKWDKNAIFTDVYDWYDGKFLKLAPENFYIIKDGKRKDYFTWSEAMEYEEKVLRPNGWRLPTSQEWENICTCYDNAGQLMKDFKLELLGYIDGYDAENDSGQVYYAADCGYFWSSTPTSFTAPSARALYLSDNRLNPRLPFFKGHSLSVRCVKAAE